MSDLDPAAAKKPAAPGAPATGNVAPPTKPVAGAPVPAGTPAAKPAAAAPAKPKPGFAATKPGAAGLKDQAAAAVTPDPKKKLSFRDRLLGKAADQTKKGPGRPPEDKEEKKPKKPPLTPEEIEDSARVAADLEIGIFSSLFGKAWNSGAYGHDDVKPLTKSHKSWIERFQIKMPWWITLIQGQNDYAGPRFRDKDVRDSIGRVFGMKKPDPKVVDAKVVQEKPHEAQRG